MSTTGPTDQHQQLETATVDGRLEVNAVVDSLTGYDEEKIERKFKAPVEELSGAKFMRALYMGVLLHRGTSPEDAYKRVMGMTQGDVADQFATPNADDEEAPDGPDPIPSTPADVDPATGAAEPRRAIVDAPQA